MRGIRCNNYDVNVQGMRKTTEQFLKGGIPEYEIDFLHKLTRGSAYGVYVDICGKNRHLFVYLSKIRFSNCNFFWKLKRLIKFRKK